MSRIPVPTHSSPSNRPLDRSASPIPHRLPSMSHSHLSSLPDTRKKQSKRDEVRLSFLPFPPLISPRQSARKSNPNLPESVPSRPPSSPAAPNVLQSRQWPREQSPPSSPVPHSPSRRTSPSQKPVNCVRPSAPTVSLSSTMTKASAAYSPPRTWHTEYVPRPSLHPSPADHLQ